MCGLRVGRHDKRKYGDASNNYFDVASHTPRVDSDSAGSDHTKDDFYNYPCINRDPEIIEKYSTQHLQQLHVRPLPRINRIAPRVSGNISLVTCI